MMHAGSSTPSSYLFQFQKSCSFIINLLKTPVQIRTLFQFLNLQNLSVLGFSSQLKPDITFTSSVFQDAINGMCTNLAVCFACVLNCRNRSSFVYVFLKMYRNNKIAYLPYDDFMNIHFRPINVCYMLSGAA